MPNAIRMPRQALAWTTAAALLCAATTARAAEPGPDTLPINVIAIQTSDVDDQAEALTKALRSAVRKMAGWSLGDGDYSLEVLTLSLKCPEPPDANCQSRIADQIKTDRYVWGTLKKKDKKSGLVKADLHLWVRGKGTSSWPIEYTQNLTDQNDEKLLEIAKVAIENLTGGPPKGAVRVRAAGVAGQVFVDGQPLGALKNGEGTFMVPSGPHKVTVKAVGYADYDAQVLVKPTGTTEVNTVLLSAGDKLGLNWKRIGGGVSLGAGVAFGVAGLVSALKVNSIQTDLGRSGDPKGTVSFRTLAGPGVDDVCGADHLAKYGTSTLSSGSLSLSDACSSGKKFQTMQVVFFPLAAVAGGVGIFLLATSGKSGPAPARTGWQLVPQVGPNAGKLDISYTF